jgi:hypothetical protein
MLTNIQHQSPSNELGVFGREGSAAGSFECSYENSSSKSGGGWISELLFASKERFFCMDFVCSFRLLNVALNQDSWDEYAKVSSYELVWNSFYQRKVTHHGPVRFCTNSKVVFSRVWEEPLCFEYWTNRSIRVVKHHGRTLTEVLNIGCLLPKPTSPCTGQFLSFFVPGCNGCTNPHFRWKPPFAELIVIPVKKLTG